MPKLIINLIPTGDKKFKIEFLQEEIALTANQAIDLLVTAATSIIDYKTEQENEKENNLQLAESQTSTDQLNTTELNNGTQPDTIR